MALVFVKRKISWNFVTDTRISWRDITFILCTCPILPMVWLNTIHIFKKNPFSLKMSVTLPVPNKTLTFRLIQSNSSRADFSSLASRPRHLIMFNLNLNKEQRKEIAKSYFLSCNVTATERISASKKIYIPVYIINYIFKELKMM